MSGPILLCNACGDTAEILPHGAELRSWRADDVDPIWAKDPAVWDQTAPVLFPVVGWTRDGSVRVAGKTYALSLHGFAWKKDFQIADRTADFARLTLSNDAETRALYPFAFRFDVTFRLTPNALENTLTVVNTGDGPLPYACGLHPAFRWPLAGSSAEHAIVFEKDERAEVPIIKPGGLFSPPSRRIPLEGRRLPLAGDMFTRDALCFLNANSRRF